MVRLVVLSLVSLALAGSTQARASGVNATVQPLDLLDGNTNNSFVDFGVRLAVNESTSAVPLASSTTEENSSGSRRTSTEAETSSSRTATRTTSSEEETTRTTSSSSRTSSFAASSTSLNATSSLVPTTSLNSTTSTSLPSFTPTSNATLTNATILPLATPSLSLNSTATQWRNGTHTLTQNVSTSETTRRQTTTSRSRVATITSSSTPLPTSSSRTTEKEKTISTTKKRKTTTSTTIPPGPTKWSKVGDQTCTSPPETFQGTEAGFATLCTVRYCDAKVRRSMIWDGNDGNVTRQEVETALGMLSAVPPVWVTGIGNTLSDGPVGQGAYNAGLLFEMTGDIRALDMVVRFSDNILALQNNPVTGEILWTGDRDPIWPTSPFYPNNKTELIGGGCEQGDIIGHMVNAAVYILKMPCLWNLSPPAFNGPTPFPTNTTYLERAQAYVAAGDNVIDNYFLKYFFDPNLALIQPNDTRWSLVGDIGNQIGEPMPWNRRMIMLHGFLRLAAAHEVPLLADPARVAQYDKIVQLNVLDFIASLNKTVTKDGREGYEWFYVAYEDHIEEAMGVHGYFDIWGLWIAWQRNPLLFGVNNNVMTRFGNTMEDTIALGNSTFSGLVTGNSTWRANSVAGLWGGWSFYSYWVPEWFDTLASANVASGFNGRSWLAIPLLWTKHARSRGSANFWRSEFARGGGYVEGTQISASYAHSSAGGLGEDRRWWTVGLSVLIIAVAWTL